MNVMRGIQIVIVRSLYTVLAIYILLLIRRNQMSSSMNCQLDSAFLETRVEAKSYTYLLKDENGTEISRTDHFHFLYYDSVFKHKNCQFQLVSQPFSTIFYIF
jgi:hypothetical protein